MGQNLTAAHGRRIVATKSQVDFSLMMKALRVEDYELAIIHWKFEEGK